MFRKKKLIWWESCPVMAGADDARIRGSLEGTLRSPAARSPFYGPVTVDADADADMDVVGLRAG